MLSFLLFKIETEFREFRFSVIGQFTHRLQFILMFYPICESTPPPDISVSICLLECNKFIITFIPLIIFRIKRYTNFTEFCFSVTGQITPLLQMFLIFYPLPRKLTTPRNVSIFYLECNQLDKLSFPMFVINIESKTDIFESFESVLINRYV
jgi:hypothetical protein